MNQKFFQLPIEKQNTIINAGFRIFSENTYKKSPMAAIAEEAGISKSLLFHYFINKQDYYFYLYDYAITYINRELNKAELQKEKDFFVIINKAITSKCKIMREHRYLNQFSLKAYFENDPSLIEELDKRRTSMIDINIAKLYDWIDCSKFKNPEDLPQLMNIILNCSEGFIVRRLSQPSLEIDDIEKEFIEMMNSLKKGFYKEEYL